MFENFYNKRRKQFPDEPKYLAICAVLGGSGEERSEIVKIFDTYMVVEDDYDDCEKKEMVDYLVTIAKDE